MKTPSVDWSRRIYPNVNLNDELNIRKQIQNLLPHKTRVYRVEKATDPNYDYRVFVSKPLSDKQVEKVESKLNLRLDFVHIPKQPIQVH